MISTRLYTLNNFLFNTLQTIIYVQIIILILINYKPFDVAHSAAAVNYADCISAEW